VPTIHSLYEDERITQIQIAERFGVREDAICNLLKGRTYKRYQPERPARCWWLSGAEVREIHAEHRAGMGIPELIVKHGRHKSSIRRILSGKSYPRLHPDYAPEAGHER
jgi:hypothetical protein